MSAQADPHSRAAVGAEHAIDAVDAVDGGAELALMLLSDGRLPAGGHAQSAGLEPALRSGMPSADIPAYLQTRLRTVTLVEAGVAVVALHRLQQGMPQGLPLVDVVDAWSARTPSEALRSASTAIGRGYLRLLRRLWPDHAVTAAVDQLAEICGPPCRPVMVAAMAAILRLRPAQLVRLVCFDDLQTVAAAALKLAPLDPADTVAWTLSMQPAVDSVVRAVAHLTDPDDIPAVGAPMIEQWAQNHAGASRRLFSA